MPNPSPLAGATPEQLEAWADSLTLWDRNLPDSLRDANRAAVDILMAVATLERETDFAIYKAGANVFIERNLPTPDVKARTIPAALAALVEDTTR